MPTTTIVIDLFGLMLIILGLHLAFRQDVARRWWAAIRPHEGRSTPLQPLTDDDPARYAMRIAGVMMLAFGVAISLLFTLSHLR